MKSIGHVVIKKVPPNANVFEGQCLNCGEILSLKTPIAVTVLVAAMKAFEKAHAGCRKREVLE